MKTLEEIDAEWLKGCEHVDRLGVKPEVCKICLEQYTRAKNRIAEKADPVGFKRGQKKKDLERNGWVGVNGKCPECSSLYIEFHSEEQVTISLDRFGNPRREIGNDKVKLLCIDCGFEGPEILRGNCGVLSEEEISAIKNPFITVT